MQKKRRLLGKQEYVERRIPYLIMFDIPYIKRSKLHGNEGRQ